MVHQKPRILVVGSFVMDVIATTEQVPGPGQTVYGKSFHTAPGGKGANQALQCARLGAEVTMVGCVGDDLFGRQLLEPLQNAGVDTGHVIVRSDCHSGVGHVTLAVSGHTAQNRIIVIPGANLTLKASCAVTARNSSGGQSGCGSVCQGGRCACYPEPCPGGGAG